MAAERRSAIVYINAALALVCAVLAVLVVMALLRQPQTVEAVQPAGAAPRQLLAWNWFALTPVSPELAVVEVADEEYDEVNIQAELLGVIIAPGGSYATIRVGREEKVFRPGDEIQSGIEVSRIDADRVVVSQRGRTLQLSFPDKQQPVTRSRPQGDTRRPSSGPSSQANFQLPNMFAAEAVQVEGYSGAYRLGSLSADIKAQTDIRDGDIVVSVGSQSINDIQSNPARWVSLSTETALPVTVIRDGQEQVVYVNALSLSARLLPDLNQD